ncbi:MAG: DsbA family protein [Alphaproteobacteria bacterium]
MIDQRVTVYIDYKSPYAYLAVEPTWTLARDYKVALEWLPYTLDIPDFLGSAKVNNQGKVLEEDRSSHQWRKVRYSYMDARRYANLRGLTIRGPQKIWDSSLAGIGLLYAQKQGKFRDYNSNVYERFWRRELDIEDTSVIKSVLGETNVDVTDFDAFAADEGRLLHDKVRTEAEKKGVFGVPTYVLDDEIFWGREHLPLIRLRLSEKGLARPGVDAPIDTTHAWRPLGPGW